MKKPQDQGDGRSGGSLWSQREHHRLKERGIRRELWEKKRRGAGQRHRSWQREGGRQSRGRQGWPLGLGEPAPGFATAEPHLVFILVVNTS